MVSTAARARGPLASIGIDAWAVDYGLLDATGELVEAPVSYRDQRTAGYRDVVERIGERRLYEIAGLQLMPINTIFQLAAHDRAALSRARHLVMLPELLAYHLTGEITAELTSAGSTGLFDLATGDWSGELLDAIESAPQLLPTIHRPGTLVGKWRDVPVHLVGGHDTASAVLGGAADGAAYVSAGTWLLVGRMLDRPDTTEAARARPASPTSRARPAASASCATSPAGGSSRSAAARGAIPISTSCWPPRRASVRCPPPTPPTSASSLPPTWRAELVAAAGLGGDASRAEIIRCAVESMAQSTAAVVAQLGLPSVQVFGGGARSELLLQLLAEHVDGAVTVGPVEATALGNAMSQGLALGVFGSVAEAPANGLCESHATSVDQAIVP